MTDNKNEKPKNSFGYTYGLYGGVGIQLVAAIGGGVWIGHFVDKKFGTTPWFLLLGILLGTMGGFYNLYVLLKREKGRNEK